MGGYGILERRIGIEISALSNMIKRRLPEPRTGKDKPLTSMQLWIVGYLFDQGRNRDVFQGELETEFNITRATASSILQRMERDGLIVRLPADRDARRKKILLTEETISNSEKAQADIDRVEEMMRQGFGAEELDCFFGILDRMKTNLM
jgi:DNA-binding MarR family transcriptional regulator